ETCNWVHSIEDASDLPPHHLQRLWSNKSAAAGGAWCVPAITEPFYNTTFLSGQPSGTPTTPVETIAVNTNPPSQTRGLKATLNQPLTFPIGIYSSGETGSIDLDIQDLVDENGQPTTLLRVTDSGGNPVANGTATITLDKTSGTNGDVVNVT